MQEEDSITDQDTEHPKGARRKQKTHDKKLKAQEAAGQKLKSNMEKTTIKIDKNKITDDNKPAKEEDGVDKDDNKDKTNDAPAQEEQNQ